MKCERLVLALIGTVLLGAACGGNRPLVSSAVGASPLSADTVQLLERQPAVVAFSVPGSAAPVQIEMASDAVCAGIRDDRIFSGRATSDGQRWHAKIIATGDRVSAVLVGDRGAWIYERAAGSDQFIPTPIVPSGNCGVTSDAQAEAGGLAQAFLADASPRRSWGAESRVLRFAVSGTYDFRLNLSDPIDAAVQNVYWVSALLERFLNVTLCPVVREEAFETARDTIYTGTKLERRKRAHRLFSELGLEYDLGQVFDIDGTSAVEVSSACDPKTQGIGITNWKVQSPMPTENVWLLAHETAHQIGATHTFNGGYNGRAAATAVEPGEGRSLLGYPDTASQQHWFHPLTVTQILEYTAARPCGKVTTTASAPAPVLGDQAIDVTSGQPFTLTIAAHGASYSIGEITAALKPDGAPPWMLPREPAAGPSFTFPGKGDLYPPAGVTLKFLGLAQDANGSIGVGTFTVRVRP